MSSRGPDPQPREFWTTSKGRTVEILARDQVEDSDDYGFTEAKVDVVAYQFLGGTMVHLRAVRSLAGWQKTDFE